MMGYYRDIPATEHAVQEGWFKTGDLGVLDEAGCLTIIGRKKELIVTTGGVNVSPHLIEQRVMVDPAVEQCVVFGDQRDFLSALIVPHERPADVQEMRAVIDRQLRELSPHEQIGQFAIIQTPFTIENQLLTPKGTFRREKIRETFAHELDRLYEA